MSWKYSDASRRIATRTNADGSCESCLVDALPEADRGKVLEPDPPAPLTKDEQDAAAAKQYAKLIQLVDMSPSQIEAWVDTNIRDASPSVKDAIKTLAIGMSVLGRDWMKRNGGGA